MHHLPVGRDGAEAGDVAELGVLAGEPTGEQVVKQGVAQALGGGETASAPSMASSMLSSTAAMARCSGRGGRRIGRAFVASSVNPNRVTPLAIRANSFLDSDDVKASVKNPPSTMLSLGRANPR